MPVRWDPLLTAALARELDLELAGRRTRSLTLDAESRRLILYLRESTLVFELHTQKGWVSLLPPTSPPADALRLDGKVRRIRALPDENAIVIEVSEKGGNGGGAEITVEWIGTRWNAIVVEGESRVIRHLLLTRDEATRTLRTGATYELPHSTGRRGADRVLAPNEWEEDRGTLLRSIAWSSGLNVASFLGPTGMERWRAMIDPANWGGWVFITPRGLQPYPVQVEGVEEETAPSLLEAFRIAREREEGTGSADGLLVPAALLERGEARLHRLRGRAHRLRKELEGAPDPVPLRLLGDLILARWGEVPSGVDRVELTDFEGVPIEVKLDPALRADENAARYYGEAGRAERALATLPEKIRKAESEVERWREIVEGVRDGRVPIDRLEKVLGKGESEGPPRGTKWGKKAGGKKGEKAGAPLPYRRYRSSGGFEIRVGRGARQNDDLTFRHAAPNEIWLHASQAAGAHVILRWDGEGSPPRRDLEEAAILAALGSGARHSKTVAVTWTRRKYVRKPRKSPPGSVMVERVQTIFVEPDEGLPERLGVEEGDGGFAG